MDPIHQVAPIQAVHPLYYAGLFDTYQETDDYLNSLDSDTRDYVLNHSGEFSTRIDLIDCVKRLHGES
jgi:hypothetical protein